MGGQNKNAHVSSVLVVKEKHGTVYMDASSESALHRSALSVVRGRLSQEWYADDDKFIVEAQRAISRKDGEYAWELLQDRRKHEYEYVELIQVVTKYLTEDSDE